MMLGDGASTFYDLDNLPAVDDIDPRVATMSTLVTNVFEGGDKSFGYGSCKDIGDMRGYTCGYVGFTACINFQKEISPCHIFAHFICRLEPMMQR